MPSLDWSVHPLVLWVILSGGALVVLGAAIMEIRDLFDRWR